MKKQREHYTPEQEVAIPRRHWVEGVPISDLCDGLARQPTVFLQRGRTNHCAQHSFFRLDCGRVLILF
jgi:hypothetical protein